MKSQVHKNRVQSIRELKGQIISLIGEIIIENFNKRVAICNIYFDYQKKKKFDTIVYFINDKKTWNLKYSSF